MRTVLNTGDSDERKFDAPEALSLVSRTVTRDVPAVSRLRGVRLANSGKKILIVAPEPRTLSALTDPPCASTRCLTIARPNPVPPASRERPLSAR